MIKCPECSESVHAEAIQCDSCGQDLRFEVLKNDKELEPLLGNKATSNKQLGMKNCPFCSEPIQATAEKCRYCKEWVSKRAVDGVQASVAKATAEKKPRSLGWTIVRIVVAAYIGFNILAFAIILIGSHLPNSTTSPSVTPPAPAAPVGIRITAGVHLGDTEVVVTNEDRFAWTEVTMYVNGVHLLGPNFKYKIAKIPAGQTRTIPATEFVSDDGTRFNPFTTKILNLFIACKTPNGEGSGGWGTNP